MSSWRKAFFRQALSDYEVFERIRRDEHIPLCHKLHYLQMTTEKLAKGFLTDPLSNTPPPKVHDAFTEFVRRTAGSHPKLYLNFKGHRKSYIASLLPLAMEIENLAPTKDKPGPNPEYPWESNQGVVCPAEYDFPTIRLETPNMVKMLGFLRVCFEVVRQEL